MQFLKLKIESYAVPRVNGLQDMFFFQWAKNRTRGLQPQEPNYNTGSLKLQH